MMSTTDNWMPEFDYDDFCVWVQQDKECFHIRIENTKNNIEDKLAAVVAETPKYVHADFVAWTKTRIGKEYKPFDQARYNMEKEKTKQLVVEKPKPFDHAEFVKWSKSSFKNT